MYRWKVKREDEILCKVDSKKILQMAANGELLVSDSVQQAGQTNWMKASCVPGLFSNTVAGNLSAIGKLSGVGLRENLATLSPSSHPVKASGDDDDDEFIASILSQAKNQPKGLVDSEKKQNKKGMVLAKDSDGIERLMDSRLVSDDAVVSQKGEQVKCLGCANWFSGEKESCPTCFRENWQGAGGRKRKIRSALKAVAFGVLCVGVAILVYALQGVEYQIIVPLEMKVFLWVFVPFIIAAAVFWARKQAMN